MPPQSLASNLNVDANIFSPMSRVRLESWKMRNEEAAASETMDIDTSKILMKAGYNQSNEGNMLKMKETEVNTYQDTHYYKASYESDMESSKPRQHQGKEGEEVRDLLSTVDSVATMVRMRPST